MKNFAEDMAVERLDIDKMHKEAEHLIDDSRIDEEDLRELYGEQVSVDLAIVSRLEKQFAERNHGESAEMKKVADLFEALVLQLGEQSNWFGENAFTIKTSHFDDYINGIDMVIEFRGDEPVSASYLGLAADVTFTADATKKFDRIREHIKKGEMGRVKYFVSDHMNIHGQLSKLPEVVIALSKKTIMELSELWMANDQKALAKHHAQIMILRQMREQIETFSLYARSIAKEEVASIYDARMAVIDNILRDKSDMKAGVGSNLEDDSVHSAIMGFLKHWKESIQQV